MPPVGRIDPEKRAAAVIAALGDAGYGARSYSGRAMYGTRCVGVTLARDQLVTDLMIDVFEACADMLPDRGLLSALRGAHTDAMGLGTIVYWPALPWPEGEPEPDKEEDR